MSKNKNVQIKQMFQHLLCFGLNCELNSALSITARKRRISDRKTRKHFFLNSKFPN